MDTQFKFCALSLNHPHDLLSSYSTSAPSVLQYFSNFICINSSDFMSPDILSWWKASWVCFYACICCYWKWGGNLICPGCWQTFQRMDGSTEKVAGFCEEGTARKSFVQRSPQTHPSQWQVLGGLPLWPPKLQDQHWKHCHVFPPSSSQHKWFAEGIW